MAQVVKKRSDTDILGQREGERLEFKRKDIFSTPDKILCEIVGMLNSTGGKIWIGVEEENGKAVRLQDVENAVALVSSLNDRVLDSISPREQRVNIFPVEFESGRLILIDVPKCDDAKKPYVLHKGSGIYVYQRFGDRLCPLTLDDIRVMMTTRPQSTKKDDRGETSRFLGDLRTEFFKAIGPATGLWVAISPVSPKDGGGGLEIQSDRVKNILLNPTELGVRRDGWTWWGGMSAKQLKLKGGAVELGVTTPVYKLLRVYRNSCITFAQGMEEMLAWRNPDWVKKMNLSALYPYAAVENPVSVFRLTGYLWSSKDFNHSSPAVAEIVFGPVEDWLLLPYQADSMGYMTAPHLDPPYGCTRPESTYIHVRIHFDHVGEIVEAPDRCAMRLLVRFYEEYGHSQDKIPFYNAQEGRFKFP